MKFIITFIAILCTTVSFAQLSGTYTIDASQNTKKTNFNNFKDAIQALKFDGLKGDVVFNVQPNTYFEPLVLEGINGDAAYSVVFQPASKGKVVFENDGIGLLVANSNNITIDNFDFESISATQSHVAILNNANGIVLKNNNIVTKDFSYKDKALVSISNTSKNNELINNTLIGYSTILLTKLSNNNNIESNYLYFDNVGIEIQSSESTNIFGNTMKGNLGIAKTALLVDGFVGEMTIASNLVSEVNVGISQTLTWRPSDKKLSGKIVNNVFECKETAVYLTNNVDGLKIDFNSFSSENSSVILITEEIKNTISNIEIIANNIVTEKAYNTILIGKESFLSSMDYNNIFNHGKAFKATVGSTQFASLADWKTGMNAEHAISADPKYVDMGNSKYLVSEDSPCINAGPNAENIGVITDYDGDLRGEVTEIGADEYNKLAMEEVNKTIEMAIAK